MRGVSGQPDLGCPSLRLQPCPSAQEDVTERHGAKAEVLLVATEEARGPHNPLFRMTFAPGLLSKGVVASHCQSLQRVASLVGGGSEHPTQRTLPPPRSQIKAPDKNSMLRYGAVGNRVAKFLTDSCSHALYKTVTAVTHMSR